MAVSLQTAAESAVQADAAQQVAGAQLDASEQAVFCFAVNCIMRAHLLEMMASLYPHTLAMSSAEI